jgi:hypothetical protein
MLLKNRKRQFLFFSPATVNEQANRRNQMKIITTSFSALQTVGTITQAIVMATFLTLILAVDTLATIPTKWLLS